MSEQLIIYAYLKISTIPYIQPSTPNPLILYTSTLTCRTSTSKRRQHSSSKALMHAKDTGIDSQTSHTQARHEVNDVESVAEKLLLVATNPSSHAMVRSLSLSADRIEGLRVEHGIFLNVVRDHEDRWEGERELQDESSSDEGGEDGDLRNRGGHDEGESPVEGNCRASR